jgi:hypothetical protein
MIITAARVTAGIEEELEKLETLYSTYRNVK